MTSSVRYGALFLLLALQLADAAVLVRFINTVPSRTGATSLKQEWRPVNLKKTSDDSAFKWFCPFGASVTATTTDATTLQDACKQSSRKDYYPGYPSRYNHVALQQRQYLDSVGLYYFAGSNTHLSAAHVVWTESPAALWENTKWTGSPSSKVPGVDNNIVAYHALRNAMPPLRKAHSATTISGTEPSEATVTDRVVNQDVPTNLNMQYRPGIADYYTHDTLKADGVGLYMSFAPGTYEFQAYGVKAPGSTGKSLDEDVPNMPERFQDSSTELTFENNKVYTIVATGSGSWADTRSNTVVLFLIEESTAPTEFGKAAIRFYHAINPKKSNSIDIYTGSTSVAQASLLYTGLNYGTETSPYFSVSPQRSLSFPLTVQGNTGDVITLAPTNSDTKAVSFDVIAGLRATAICATTSEDRPQEIFCRMIPSRVVAYVRLIADTAGFDGLVQGKFGPNKLSETDLQLWASYEFPKPALLAPGNRDMSSASNNAGAPAASVGLYPVVSAAPGDVSGYGEVHVPIFIMDFAVATRIAPSCSDGYADTTTAALFRNAFSRINPRGAMCFNRAGTYSGTVTNYNNIARLQAVDQGYVSPSVKLWHDHAPIFKRVNMVLKTDGMATIVNTCNLKTNAEKLNGGEGYNMLTDLYMEPGQYYSVAILPQTNKACNDKLATASLQYGSNFRIAIQRDISIAESSQSLRDGWARISFIPLGDPMNWVQGNVEGTFPTGAETGGAYDGTLKQYLQQTFWGTVVATDTTSASEENLLVGFAQYSFREVLPGLKYPVHDWDGTTEGYNTASPPVRTAFANVPEAPKRHEIRAGTYSLVHTSSRAASTVTGEECFRTIPKTTVELEAGKTYHFFVMNQFGCRFDTNLNQRQNTGALVAKLVEVSAFDLKHEGGTSFFGGERSSSSSVLASASGAINTLLTGDASSTSSSMAIVMAALFALVALVL